MDQLLTSVGLIVHVRTKSHENYQKLKPHIMHLSKIELKKTGLSMRQSQIPSKIIQEALCLRKAM